MTVCTYGSYCEELLTGMEGARSGECNLAHERFYEDEIYEWVGEKEVEANETFKTVKIWLRTSFYSIQCILVSH